MPEMEMRWPTARGDNGAARRYAGPQAADKVRGAEASGPCRGLGQSPKALCRSISCERCERLKGARNAALLKIRGFFNGLRPGVTPGRCICRIRSVRPDRARTRRGAYRA